ncbi:MAG: alpha-L-arabinofuranosidase C-terminal domain-containing protein [Verrucomicrobiia bacterium]|jgi:alpha-L-arabinofuranosidase
MKTSLFVICSLLVCGAILNCGAEQTATLTVQANKPGHKIAPTLWGIFFEDINLSADGGIYPELVRNRSFEDCDEKLRDAKDSEMAKTLLFWSVRTNGSAAAGVAIDDSQPLNPFNRRSLRWDVNGATCLVNEGYYGMGIKAGAEYRLSLAARATNGFSGALDVTVESKAGQPLAQGKIEGIGGGWKMFALNLKAAGTDSEARLLIGAAGKGSVWLDMVSLMPKKTWKDHGLRADLCEMLAAMKPSFVRFPGGCWVEGDNMSKMYHWKNTIGDIAHRTPLWNIWQYNATHGLGYHEYLQLSEDLGAEPLFCINVGMSHKEVVPMDQMGQWVQDALDAIEYANGPTNTVWGGRRAKNGHPAPFNMKYLEIGNENGGPAYHERWPLFVNAIKAKYPQMQLIANVWGGYPSNAPPAIIDEHYYNVPEFFMAQAGKYDKYDRKGPKVFVGEYAVTRDCGLGNLRGAVGEAAFMTGMERNSDVVIMAAYAPLFCNANHKRWPINLINFDSSRAFGLPGYYVQKLFSEHRGDVTVPLDVKSPAMDQLARAGNVGVGTWATQAEFKDIKVTGKDGRVLFASDFSKNMRGWKLNGGKWEVADGALRQTSLDNGVHAMVGEKTWRDYTFTLKARKLDGAEGFLIPFQVQRDKEKSWWNLGGWGNKRHGLEVPGIHAEHVDGAIETGRWYDIKIECLGPRVRCYLDGKLIHDVTREPLPSLYASASRAKKTGELILKVVNGNSQPLATAINLKGLSKVKTATAIVLTSASGLDENTLDEPTKVAPKTQTLNITSPSFRHTFPGNSVTVMRLK